MTGITEVKDEIMGILFRECITQIEVWTWCEKTPIMAFYRNREQHIKRL